MQFFVGNLSTGISFFATRKCILFCLQKILNLLFSVVLLSTLSVIKMAGHYKEIIFQSLVFLAIFPGFLYPTHAQTVSDEGSIEFA